MGISLMYIHSGLTNFDVINLMAPLLDNYCVFVGNASVSLTEIAATLFVVGGGVKSAQFGFHI